MSSVKFGFALKTMAVPTITTAALLSTPAPAMAETHINMPTVYTLATDGGGLCAGTLNAKVNVFDDSDAVNIGYQTSFGGTGGCLTTAVFTWRNLDTGNGGTITNQVVSWSYSASFKPGPGRVAVEMSTTSAHFPLSSRLEVVVPG